MTTEEVELPAQKPPGESSDVVEEEIITWRVPKESEHEDFYIRFLRHRYMPLLAAFNRHIIFLWFIIFAVCVVYGPAFLTSTKSNLDLPKGTPSAEAVDAFTANYPLASSWPGAFVVAHSNVPGVGVRSQMTKQTYAQLNALQLKYSDTISRVGGYYNLMAAGFTGLADTMISADNSTMLCAVDFKKETTLVKIYDVAEALLSWSKDVSTPAMSFYTTGIFPLFSEMQKQTSEDFATIDEIVLPICIVILGISLNSYRHMGVALVNLINTILLAFGILIPITRVVDINPFSPSILLSLGIAVCFDYSLFMLTRFKEERLSAKRCKEDAVFHMLCNSGHVVMLSGCTLFTTFILLLIFPQNFLQSVGYTCAIVVLSAMIVNMSITPCMLLAFECLSHFDGMPYSSPALSCCCYVPAGSPGDVSRRREEDFSARAKEPRNYLTRVCYFFCGGGVKEEESLEMIVAAAAQNQNHLNPQKVGLATSSDVEVVSDCSPSDVVAPQGQQQQQQLAPAPFSAFFSRIPGYIVTRSPWFNVSWFCVTNAKLVMLITIGITIPFLVTFINFKPTSDAYLIYLQTSRSLKGLKTMSSAFNEGRLDPYFVVMSAGVPGAVLTEDYFTVEKTVVQWLISSETKYLDPSGITALSYFQGQYVSLATAQGYLSSTSAYGLEYRTFVGGLVSSTGAASLIKCELKVAPNAEIAVGFIRSVRNQLTAYTSTSPVPARPVKMYLFGGYTTTLDVQTSLFDLVPVMIAVTVIIVIFMIGVSFGSVLLALRLAFTVFISLCWTFGLMVLVYQPGDGQDAFASISPTITSSTGIYWLIPIMSFSILVGLALDYDIFLMSRVVEYRRLGWSDGASVCLAIEKTASIITAAGTIMSISFAGLLIPKTIVLNQYGFVLFIGVAFDTFIIRTIVVPATINLLGGDNWKFARTNWWPGTMPPLAYASAKEEREALLRGLWVPDAPPRQGAAELLELEGGSLEKGPASPAGEEGKVSDVDSKVVVASG